MPPLVLFHPQTEGLHRGQRIGKLWSQKSPAVLASLEEAERESRPAEISEVRVCHVGIQDGLCSWICQSFVAIVVVL